MQKEYTIKPEQDSKVEKTTLTAALDFMFDYTADIAGIGDRSEFTVQQLILI